DSLNANNMFTIYNRTALKLEPLFGGHHFWPPGSPIEGNVWGTVFGRGTFEKYYKKSLRAVDYQENPYEVRYQIKIGKNGKEKHARIKEMIENEKITGNFGTKFEELCNSKNILLKCTSSEDLSFIPDGMIDAVISDPPYYDNIMYSELSDFFYVWLRLGLKDLYPEVFSSRFTIKDREILVSKTQRKEEDFYIEGMANVFKEVHRVLKSKGLMIFVFQHKKAKAWSALLRALLKADFCVKAAYPTHGETPSGVRAYGMNYNSILVCTKLLDTDQKQLSPMEVENHLRTTIEKEITRILNKRPYLTVEDGFILGMGKGLQVYSQNYGELSKNKGEFEVSGSYMQKIRDIVFDSILKCILAWVPNVDWLSQIYLSTFSNKDKIAIDTLNSLKIYENIGIHIFEEEKLLKRIKKKKLLDVLHPNQRIEFINRKFDKNIPLNYIDAAHLLWSTWESKGGFERVLERISKTGIEPGSLREYVKFLGERTDYIIWKRIEKALTSP
ncbi:MAG: DNA methyltransferase, partial [Promethearchaeota archaeon]